MKRAFVKNAWRTLSAAAALAALLAASPAHAAREDCGELPANFPKPAVETDAEDVNVQNDYDQTVEEDTRPGVVYLALANGSSPDPNDCGLSPTNDQGAWTGWGGPVDLENVTIGEGPGTRNEIVIGGVYFLRGIGNHAAGSFTYSLTGGNYVQFEAWVGMSDEKDPGDCGHGGSSAFTFSIDGDEVLKTETLRGVTDGENTPAFHVLIDISSGAQELTIAVGDGGDGNGCDHSALGDAKLLTNATLSVDPNSKASSLWGDLKARQ